jgi:hypothetical protein
MTEDQIELIKRAAAAVVKQGRRALGPVWDGCVYENAAGDRCIVGHMVAELSPETVLKGLSFYGGLDLAGSLSSVDETVLRALQKCHDAPYDAVYAFNSLDPRVQPAVQEMINVLKANHV